MSDGQDGPTYGLWGVVFINSAVFVLFAFSFLRPKTKTDWRTLGAFSAFIVALFVEMYGFPLTIYVLSGWLQSEVGEVDILSHDAGHLWDTLLGLEGDPHRNPIHIASNILIFAGMFLLGISWKVLWSAQRKGRLASAGPYAHVRHPQYLGLILIMLGLFVMWPTLLTLLMCRDGCDCTYCRCVREITASHGTRQGLPG